MNRVVITGMGWITPMGHAIDAVWKRLLERRIGHRAARRSSTPRTFPTTFSAEVKDFRPRRSHPRRRARTCDAGRNTQFALAACLQAWKTAGLDADKLDLDRVGIYLGCGEGSLDFDAYTTAALASWKPERRRRSTCVKWAEIAAGADERRSRARAGAEHAAVAPGAADRARGPALNCLTACAARTQAIGEATEILRRGDADVMIGGGAHSMIHPFGVTGFNRLTALSTAQREPAAAPAARSTPTAAGSCSAKARAWSILETLEHATAARRDDPGRGRRLRLDRRRLPHHRPAPRRRWRDRRHAARRWPTRSSRPPTSSTSTPTAPARKENDGNETGAIKKVFGEHAKNVPVSSIKSMMGHLIAAAGAVELITCVLAIRDNILPPTMNLREPRPRVRPRLRAQQGAARRKVDVAMSNSFGFGGQNDTIIVKKFVA